MNRTICLLLVVLFLIVGCQGERPQPRGEVASVPSAADPADPPKEKPAAQPAKSKPSTPPAIPALPQIPGTKVRTVTWEMGVIRPGAEPKHRFEIKNDSNYPWTVRSIMPTCSCSVGDLTPKTLKPSETAHLDVAFKAGQGEGEFYQAVMVDFKPFEAPKSFLVMRGEIRNPFSAVPRLVDFGGVTPGERFSRTVELRNYTEADYTITRVETPDWLRAEYAPAEKKDAKAPYRQVWNLTVTADLTTAKTLPEGGEVIVHTSSPQIAALKLPVKLRPKELLEVVPSDLVLEVEAGQTGEKTVLLEVSPQLGALTEKDIAVTHMLGKKFTVEVTKLSATRFKLLCRFAPQHLGDDRRGEVEIKVQGKEAPPARLRVALVPK